MAHPRSQSLLVGACVGVGLGMWYWWHRHEHGQQPSASTSGGAKGSSSSSSSSSSSTGQRKAQWLALLRDLDIEEESAERFATVLDSNKCDDVRQLEALDEAAGQGVGLAPEEVAALNCAVRDTQHIERGYKHYLRSQHGEALAAFQQCQGGSVALGYQARLLWGGGTGLEKDKRAAKQLGREAMGRGLVRKATQGNRHAQCVLGFFHHVGLEVKRDERQAAGWYEKAAAQGDALAQNNLGVCYEYGTGVETNAKRAARLYAQAADQGNAMAHFNLGRVYHNGTGVQKDDERAKECFRVAAELGDEHAKRAMGRW